MIDTPTPQLSPLSEDLKRAVCLHQKGNLDEARQIYLQILGHFPEHSDALHLLGVTAYQAGEFDKAVHLISRAVQLSPEQASYYLNLGNTYKESNLLEQAVTCFKKAIDIKPDYADSYYNLGNTLSAQGKFDSAIPYYQHAVKLKPSLTEAYLNLGIEYHLSGELDKSIQFLEQAVALSPDHCDALNLLVHLLQRTCDWHKLDIFAPQLDRLTESALKSKNSTAEAVYANVLRHADPSLNFFLAQNRSRKIVQQVSGIRTNFTHARSVSEFDKIKLGYFSADIRNHPIAHLIRGLFGLHDRGQFEVYCYSYGKDDGSRYRHQIMRDCDRFVDVQNMSSCNIAGRIYEDRICILIDLMGYTAGNRLDVCALRPAPVQVTYLGFPGTTGADFMDYIITDKIVSPLEHENFYSEKLVYMPHCYQVNNHCQEIADKDWRRIDFGLPEDGFIFSSFNQPVKIEPLMFDCWMRIIRRVPHSVLWLLWNNGIAEDNLRSAAQERGINPDRLVFTKKLSKEKHLARMRLADLALDTRVYNGHTTTSDSLWAGTPVIALQGRHFASRVSASILTAIKLLELITHNLKEYENLAVHLALDRDNLIYLRQRLMSHRHTKPLFDTARFTKNLEFAFKKMWQVYQRSDPPRLINVKEQENL